MRTGPLRVAKRNPSSSYGCALGCSTIMSCLNTILYIGMFVMTMNLIYIQTQNNFTQQYMKTLLENHKRKSRHNEIVLACGWQNNFWQRYDVTQGEDNVGSIVTPILYFFLFLCRMTRVTRVMRTRPEILWLAFCEDIFWFFYNC